MGGCNSIVFNEAAIQSVAGVITALTLAFNVSGP